MPDTVELSVIRALNGESLGGDEAEICDFSLEEQNAALESQGVQPSVSASFKPVVKETVTFIVAVVLINEADEVLLMQEAKQKCAGQWYLPAGRMEKGERVLEAAKREVLEETGLEFEPSSLLMLECAGGNWLRFVLTGAVTGGRLKTPAEADTESLQAKWVRDLGELTLRKNDIIPLINRAKQFKEARQRADQSWYKDQLPALRPHAKIFLRLVVVIKKRATNRIHVLISEKNSFHLPMCEVHPTNNIHSTLRRFMVDLFGAEVAPHRPHGIISVEHDGQSQQDGACLTLLVTFKAPLEEVPIIAKCVWHEASKDLAEKLLGRISSKNSTIPMNVIR